MLSAPENCPLYQSYSEAAKTEINAKIDADMESSQYWDVLRRETDNPNASAETLNLLSEYIVKMERSGYSLNFELTKEERAHAEVSEGRDLYAKSAATEFLSLVPTYVLMQQLLEFIAILQGSTRDGDSSSSLRWQDAPYFSEYFKAAGEEEFPKYILYSGNGSNMNPLLRVLAKDGYKFT